MYQHITGRRLVHPGLRIRHIYVLIKQGVGVMVIALEYNISTVYANKIETKSP